MSKIQTLSLCEVAPGRGPPSPPRAVRKVWRKRQPNREMAPASTSKKRKRDDNEAKVSFALSDQPKSQLGPVLGE